MKTMYIAISLILMLSNCQSGDTTNSKRQLLGNDYNLFEHTPVKGLATAVRMQDTDAIKTAVALKKIDVDYRDPVYGQTLLKMAVYNREYNSVKALLEVGADPNKQSTSDKISPLMEAARLGGGGRAHRFADSRYLRLLLKFGANPNAVQDGGNMKKGQQSYLTPLEIASLSGILEYVNILVDGGADVNLYSKDGFSPLFASIVSGNPDIVLFLINKGASYDRPMYTTPAGKKMYILDAINNIWSFDKSSKEFEKETQIKDIINNYQRKKE
ncbi:MAG TPA: ankyrin repeat domain-containing protein [Mucilaginibacter sp.]|nr:ankyrin repeat domain-containing protein [Mucilaginibacter sp.]